MENSGVKSQSVSSISTSNQAVDHHAAGSTSNPPELINHGKCTFLSGNKKNILMMREITKDANQGSKRHKPQDSQKEEKKIQSVEYRSTRNALQHNQKHKSPQEASKIKHARGVRIHLIFGKKVSNTISISPDCPKMISLPEHKALISLTIVINFRRGLVNPSAHVESPSMINLALPIEDQRVKAFLILRSSASLEIRSPVDSKKTIDVLPFQSRNTPPIPAGPEAAVPRREEVNCSKPIEFCSRQKPMTVGLLLWIQTRQQWIGKKQSENRAPRIQEPRLSWNATYESLLGTNKPFPQPIPLSEMVDFLVDIWEQEEYV